MMTLQRIQMNSETPGALAAAQELLQDLRMYYKGARHVVISDVKRWAAIIDRHTRPDAEAVKELISATTPFLSLAAPDIQGSVAGLIHPAYLRRLRAGQALRRLHPWRSM